MTFSVSLDKCFNKTFMDTIPVLILISGAISTDSLSVYVKCGCAIS